MVLPLRALKDGVAAESASSMGVLVAEADGALSIQRSTELASVGAHVDVAEVPLLIDGGAVVPGVSRGKALDRAALGMTGDGRVLVARGDSVTEMALAEVLLRAGCTRAALLDRGLQARGFLHRAGTASPPRARYDVTTLYAMGAPMKPRAFRFEALPALAEARRK
jgi:hypothetical protein